MVTAGLADPDHHKAETLCSTKSVVFFVVCFFRTSAFLNVCVRLFHLKLCSGDLRGNVGSRVFCQTRSPLQVFHTPMRKEKIPPATEKLRGPGTEAGPFCPRLLAERVLVQDLVQNHGRFQPQGRQVFYLVT